MVPAGPTMLCSAAANRSSLCTTAPDWDWQSWNDHRSSQRTIDFTKLQQWRSKHHALLPYQHQMQLHSQSQIETPENAAEWPLIKNQIQHPKINRREFSSLTITRQRGIDDRRGANSRLHGQKVCQARRGARYAESRDYDIIIGDLQMPGMKRTRFRTKTLASTVRCASDYGHRARPSRLRSKQCDTGHSITSKNRSGSNNSKRSLARIRTRSRADQVHVIDSNQSDSHPTLIGSSRLMTTLRARINQVARTNETVLITGESGDWQGNGRA